MSLLQNAFRIAIVLLFAFAAVPALAQKAGQQNGPAEEKPAAQKDFSSPFNGDKKPDSPEAQDFAKLEELGAKLQAAACGDSEADAANARAAYEKALEQYVRDWSTNSYMGDPTKNPDTKKTWDADKATAEAGIENGLAKKSAGCPKGIPKKFTSPFGAEKEPNSAEAKDFAYLVDLFKTYDTLNNGSGSSPGEDVIKKIQKARKDFYDAYERYIKTWSEHAKKYGEVTEPEKTADWLSDSLALSNALTKAVKETKKTGGGAVTPKKRKRGKRARSEADPLYMENYSSPSSGNVSTSPSHGDEGAGGSSEPPRPDEGDRRSPAEGLPTPPNSPSGTPY